MRPGTCLQQRMLANRCLNGSLQFKLRNPMDPILAEEDLETKTFKFPLGLSCRNCFPCKCSSGRRGLSTLHACCWSRQLPLQYPIMSGRAVPWRAGRRQRWTQILHTAPFASIPMAGVQCTLLRNKTCHSRYLLMVLKFHGNWIQYGRPRDTILKNVFVFVLNNM